MSCWAAERIWLRFCRNDENRVANGRHLASPRVEIDADDFKNASFFCNHADDVEIHVNGILAATASGRIDFHTDIAINESGRKALKRGKNVLAVRCHHIKGGQYIDVGMICIKPGSNAIFKQAAAASLPSQLQSKAMLSVVKLSGGGASIFWLDNSVERSYGVLAANQKHSFITYLNHAWRARLKDGRVIDFTVGNSLSEWNLNGRGRSCDVVWRTALCHKDAEIGARERQLPPMCFEPLGKPGHDVLSKRPGGYLF